MQRNAKKFHNAFVEVTAQMKPVSPFGFVGAGKNVVQFPHEANHAFVSAHNKNTRIYIVSGDSLENPDNERESIYDNDKIVVEMVSNINDIKCNSVCVVEIPSQDLWLAKKLCVHGNQVVLKSVNPKYGEISYHIDDVVIVGIIVEKCQKYP